jgi:outer membrane lipoprotein-sorting protein
MRPFAHLVGLFLALLLLGGGLTVPAQAQSAQEVFEEVERRQKLVQNERAEIEMVIEDSRGRTRSRSMQVLTKVGSDGRQRSLLVFTGPADIRGTGLLTVETASGDDQKLYLPALGRVQRVAGSQRAERFAGSDFTFEDLGSRDPDQYTVTMVDRGADAFVIEARPLDRDSQYSRIVLTVDRNRYVIRAADHYDRRDRLAKVLTADRFTEVVPGAHRASRLVMEDVIANRRTVLTFASRETPRELSDDLFTERQLQRGLR